MKNSILNIALAFAGVAALSSCSDFLDKAPKEELSDASFWKSSTDAETNGTLSLVCLSGNDKIRLSGETSLRVTGSDSLCVEIEGIKASDALDDVSLVARFEPDSSSGVKDEGCALTVVQVNDVVLPGAPDDGLVISTGTSVALDMEVVPSTAKGRLSTSYYVRRLL